MSVLLREDSLFFISCKNTAAIGSDGGINSIVGLVSGRIWENRSVVL